LGIGGIAVVGSSLILTTGGLDDPDQAVEAGRDALDRWWGYPWYDPAADGVAPVNVREPYDWSWLDFNLGLTWPASALEWLVWSGVLLAVLLIAYLLIQAYRSRRPRPEAAVAAGRPKRDDAERVEALPFPVRGDLADLLGEARRLYDEGDYGRAIAYLFSYQLVHLDRRHRIRLARGKTNRQYLRELGGQSGLRGLLEQTMVAFEDAFFGRREIPRERFEQCWFRIGEFESLAAEGA
jgi:hypothetical protein